MQIKELQQISKNIIQKIDEKNPSDSAILITTLKAVEEIGELSEDIVNLHHGQRKRKYKSEQDIKENIGTEIADIVIVLAVLSERLSIDLEHAITKKLQEEHNRWTDE